MVLTYLIELGRKSANSLNITRILYDIIKDIEAPVVVESALFTLIYFLSSASSKLWVTWAPQLIYYFACEDKAEQMLEDSQYEVLSRKLATVLCSYQDRPEMFKNASKLLHFICIQGKANTIQEEHVKNILEALDAFRIQPIDGREVSFSHIIAMLLAVTSLRKCQDWHVLTRVNI